MSDTFFSRPILNSPYECPARQWELDKAGQPTGTILPSRRVSSYLTPIPKARKRSGKGSGKDGTGDDGQQEIVFADAAGLSTKEQQYDPTPIVNLIRQKVAAWRATPNPNHWGVTPETARLLQHWRSQHFQGIRPFFCQVEAVETAIWLTEVAPSLGKEERGILDYLSRVNEEANPGLPRLALKLATGAGKTTVMAMLIAWQTINAVRRPGSRKFTKGFLIITPGITIKDRLRVLQPNDPNSYFKTREIVPDELRGDILKAKVVITNYHAFKRRETMELAKGNRALLEGRGEKISTIETEGMMLQRVMAELMAMKQIVVLNDEAHHCYREKPPNEDGPDDDTKLTGDDRKEAERNTEAARLWISGIEAIQRKLGVARVFDLSATPFFLSGSGYREGTLFPWTMSDFSLMDAIECGIVKLPRVPVADNIPNADMPMYRDLWAHIGKKMPKKGRGKGQSADPNDLPPQLQTALEALYGHYAKTHDLWQKAGIQTPPCFIVVCNNTASSKLVYDFIAGYERVDEHGGITPVNGRFELFRNYDEHLNRLPRPNTLLIDSVQLESGDALDANFREAAADEIERFRNERLVRSNDHQQASNMTDQDLLREVMNTVGKAGGLGESIRCVVSVGMLTEGWDANTVTHVLGVRAFGTQLLCEQVIGRALRRQSYELNADGLFNVEYADVLGIPFDFTAKPVHAPIQTPRETVHVEAVNPERQHLEISFPRVAGYRVELPKETLTAVFTDDSTLVLTPDLVGATKTQNSGIIGEQVDLDLVHTNAVRPSTILYHLSKHLVQTKWRDGGDDPKYTLFGQLKRIAKQWLDGHLVCKGGTFPAQLLYMTLADMACEKITAAITRGHEGTSPIKAILDPFNPIGSTAHVNFNTSKSDRWQTGPDRSHVNWVVLDSGWEAEFCRAAERHPRVIRYVKNHGLGFEVPYVYGSESRRYIPDFIVVVDDGRGPDDLLNLVVEIKGYRGEDAKIKKETMETRWVPGVNNTGRFGRWKFAEFTDVWEMEEDFAKVVEEKFGELVDSAVGSGASA